MRQGRPRRSGAPWASVLLLVGAWACASGEPVADIRGDELLDRTIAFHDPDGRWPQARVAVTLAESRPDGSVRSTNVYIDRPADSVLVETEREGRAVALSFYGDEVDVDLDGEGAPTAEVAEQLRLTADQALRLRNYYLYLYGLPMKLRDPGTRVDRRVLLGDFRGRDALVLRVTYDPEAGSDTWLFYVDPETFEMFGYRFFHDEAAGDGEYITLEGLAEVGGLRLPKTRTWYRNQGDELLGTDDIVNTNSLD